jgi:hypothetical protein
MTKVSVIPIPVHLYASEGGREVGKRRKRGADEGEDEDGK